MRQPERALARWGCSNSIRRRTQPVRTFMHQKAGPITEMSGFDLIPSVGRSTRVAGTSLATQLFIHIVPRALDARGTSNHGSGEDLGQMPVRCARMMFAKTLERHVENIVREREVEITQRWVSRILPVDDVRILSQSESLAADQHDGKVRARL